MSDEKANERSRRSYAKNKEAIRSRRNQWYADSKELQQQYRKWAANWKSANAEKSKGIRLKYSMSLHGRFNVGQRNAKKRSYDWRISLEEYSELISEPCHYCGRELDPMGCGLDRKNDEPYYTKYNVVPCCGRCNSTFIKGFRYEQKMILARALREIDGEEYR